PFPPPLTDFAFTPTQPLAGDTVQFTNTTQGLFTASFWNFGDGATSAATHPAHAYAAPGTYTVTLTVSGPGGSSQKQKAVTVRAVQPPLVVPVIARVAGIGTPWRSDVVLANPASSPLPLALEYRPSGSGTAVIGTVTLGPKQARLFEDAVATLFAQGDGRGSVVLVPPREGPAPAVFSRTFSVQSGSRRGQGIPAGVVLPRGTYFVTGLFEDSQMRTNLGVTGGPEAVTATFELYRGTQGKVAGPVSKTIGPYDQQQWRLSDLFSGAPREGVPMTVRLNLSAPAAPWASVVDQASGDAVYIQAMAAGSPLLVPVVASLQGLAFWDTDLTLANPTGTPTVVSLEYLPENRNNQGGGTVLKTVTLAPGETRVVERLFTSLLGVGNTKGSLSLASGQPIVAACRVYTPTTQGTYGQGVPVLPVSAFSSGTRFVTGVRNRDGFRTNVGLLTPSGGVNATARLYDGSGSKLAERSDLYVPPRSLQQFRLEDLFPGAPVPNPAGSLEVIPSGPLAVYLSVVDGTSQDPVLVLVP
ncbi:MAG: PKD domain-containing protein, partial [Thermoanaerobaculum sp.]